MIILSATDQFGMPFCTFDDQTSGNHRNSDVTAF
jgi:hypothetical protein